MGQGRKRKGKKEGEEETRDKKRTGQKRRRGDMEGKEERE